MAPVAPLNSHQLLVFLLQIGLLLGSALVLGRSARRLGMPAIVGELFAGVLLGPSLLDHVAPGFAGWLLPQRPDQQHLLDAAGQFGVLLLVGITGMHIDLDLVKRQGMTAVRVSAGGLLVPLGIGVGVGFLLPGSLLVAGEDRTVFAWFLGVALCVSAIPVIAKTLLEMRLLHRDIGQQIVNSAVVDDAVGWLLLSVVSAMATTGVHASGVARSVAGLAGVVVFTIVLGRPLVRVIMRLAGRSEGDGSGVAAAVVVIFLCGAGTQALGMESVLGAFLGGILLSSAGWGAGSERLAALRTFVMAVLAPLYFATAGLRADLTALTRPAVAVTAVAVLLVAVIGKFVGAYTGARASRLGHWEALSLGAGMNARGVIGLVIAMVGLRLNVLSTAMYTIVVLVAIVTSVMAPPILRYAVRRIEVTSEEEHREQVLLGGYR
ncbi:cation:proton antiporter [Actinoallomurus sp. NPDC050550]|uniref:cation:proton antiporter n=1 Tax=Actinoallomurus sp. NPDC050550 TaxID=3154937 RepID=UPI0033E99640